MGQQRWSTKLYIQKWKDMTAQVSGLHVRHTAVSKHHTQQERSNQTRLVVPLCLRACRQWGNLAKSYWHACRNYIDDLQFSLDLDMYICNAVILWWSYHAAVPVTWHIWYDILKPWWNTVWAYVCRAYKLKTKTLTKALMQMIVELAEPLFTWHRSL